jgi:uncharacterized protein YdeI (BOF family)
LIKRFLLSSILVCASLPALGQSQNISLIAEVPRGGTVTVQGQVERVMDYDEFRIADETGSIEVYVGPTRIDIAVGEALTVTGFVDSDLGPRDICASEIVKADGTVIAVPNCDG